MTTIILCSGSKIIQDTPVANSAPKRAVRAFEKLYVAMVRVVAHFRKRTIDLVSLGVGEPAQLPLGAASDHQAPIHAAQIAERQVKSPRANSSRPSLIASKSPISGSSSS